MSVFYFAHHYDPFHHWRFKLFSWNLLSISILNHIMAYLILDCFWVCIHLWYYILRTRTILLMLDRWVLVDGINFCLISDHLLFTNAIQYYDFHLLSMLVIIRPQQQSVFTHNKFSDRDIKKKYIYIVRVNVVFFCCT